MKLKLGLATTLVAALTLTALVGMHAFAGGGKTNVKADVLTGYQEATPAGVSTQATGTFEATIDDEAQTITYRLTYSGLSAPATQAHIHFGNRFTSGGVSVWFCGSGAVAPHPLTCPAGTATEAVLTGTFTPADVAGPASQGIAAGEFGELVDAMRAGMTYVNVHDTPTFGAGEIRGQINDDNQRQP
jgi:hypothetical protein